MLAALVARDGGECQPVRYLRDTYEEVRGAIAATDAVHDGDMVSVSYHDMSGTMHAASVRVTSTNMTKK